MEATTERESSARAELAALDEANTTREADDMLEPGACVYMCVLQRPLDKAEHMVYDVDERVRKQAKAASGEWRILRCSKRGI